MKAFCLRGIFLLLTTVQSIAMVTNEYLQEVLWEQYHILMIMLPPYHPELNPTELVFCATLTKLSSMRSNDEDF